MTDPLDPTQPNPTTSGETAATPDAAGLPPASAAGPDPDGGGPGLRVDPARQSDPSWREPAWYPPRDGRDRPDRADRRSGTFAVIVGLILIAIGAWYFLETTLGLDLPQLRWGSLWPLILIVIGGLILVRSVQRRP